MLTALLVVGILVVLIVAHELGHFIVAKIARVRVDEFGIGYPPRAFLLGTFGGTAYTINWLPFGGFVRLFGENEEAPHAARSFTQSSRATQALILIAGVAMNALLAWILFAGALHAGVPRAVDAANAGSGARLLVSRVVPGSPADAAGLIAGDEILSVTSVDSGETAPRSPEGILSFVQGRGGQALEVASRRSEETHNATIRPAHAVIVDAAERPALGVGLVLVEDVSLPWREAALAAFSHTARAFAVVGTGLWDIVRGIVSPAPALRDVVGPVGLVGAVGDAAQHGFGSVLQLAAFISVNLVFINLLPIPALDGGRLAILGVEAAMRRDAPRLAVQVLNSIGIALIALLMLAVTYHDIARLLA